MENWKFNYTKETGMKRATNKNGSLISGKGSFIKTTGKDYSECFTKAMQECSFNERQLIGSIKLN